MTPRVCVVILNWNLSALTESCLDHLAGQQGVGFDTLVIDNGSAPDQVRRLDEACAGRCPVLRFPRNVGFAAGMNAGIRAAARNGFELVWLLNNDAFPDAGCLAALVEALDADPQLAMVTPYLYDRDGEEQPPGGRIDWAIPDVVPLPADALAEPVGRGYWLTGTAPLGRTEYLLAVGGFDRRFFAYWEDVDLSARIAEQGGQFRVVMHARCRHLGGSSSGGATSPFVGHLDSRNRYRFFRKHSSWRAVVPVGLRSAALALARAGWMFGDKPDVARGVIGGLCSAVVGRTGPPGRLTAPRWLEYLLLRHCWRLRTLALSLANFLDRSGGATEAGR